MEQKDISIKNEKLDKLFLSIGKSLCGEPPFYIWPAPYSSPAECEFYLADYFLRDFYASFVKLEQKGYNVENIARMLKNPSRIAQLLWPFGHVVNVDGKFKKQLTELASLIIDFISFYKKDPFNQNGRNIIWSSRDISNYLSNEIIESSNDLFESYKAILSRLEGTLWLYSELLFFSIHEICKEFHGPYPLEDGRLILVREYYDLKPEFWPFAADLPYQKLLIFEIYRKNTKITFDFFGRFRTIKPLIQELDSFSLMIDDKTTLAYGDVKSVWESVSKTAVSGAKFAQKLSKMEIMEKFAYSYYYILKPLKDALNEEWQPSRMIFDDMKHERRKTIIENFYSNFRKMKDLPPDKMVEIISKVFDPRLR